MNIYKPTLAAMTAVLILLTAPTYAASIVGDGVVDDTAAIQSALDTAGKTGGEVSLPAGRYLIKGHLTVPTGVAMVGSWDAPHHGAWDKGSTLMITGGRGEETGTATITLEQSSAIRGFTLLWPDQRAENIVPYPWAIHGHGMHNTVENVTFVNAYQGILIGQPGSELHVIRNIFGCVLRRGVMIDSTSDVGRVENVHFNTHYWLRSGYQPILTKDAGRLVPEFAMANCEAFILARADWEDFVDTFVWGAKIGYHFVKSADGACNGQFTGIMADDCRVGIQVDNIQSAGIQVTNGEFTAFAGEPNAGIVISPGCTGPAQFLNCNFWTTPGGAAQVHGNAQVVFNSCHFENDGKPAVISADNGHIVVTACSFAGNGPAVDLERGVKSAIITSNLQGGGLIVDNHIGSLAQIGLNEVAYTYPKDEIANYRVKIGDGDESVLNGGWNSGEDADDVPADLKGKVTTARWTEGDAKLKLPVIPGQAYTMTVWLLTRDKTPVETVTVDGGPSAAATVGKSEKLTLEIPASTTAGKDTIAVSVAGKSWSPSEVFANSGDTRRLGARVFAVEMKAAGAAGEAVDLE